MVGEEEKAECGIGKWPLGDDGHHRHVTWPNQETNAEAKRTFRIETPPRYKHVKGIQGRSLDFAPKVRETTTGVSKKRGAFWHASVVPRMDA